MRRRPNTELTKDVDQDRHDYEREERRHDLIAPAMRSPHLIHNPRALQHLREGFNRRVLMLEITIRRIQDQIRKADGPIPAPAVLELAIFVNSFWLNICGALDNLAWALNHELSLIPTAVEDSGADRFQVKLFRKKFWSALSAVRPAIIGDLERFRDWYSDLSALRDPSAHRIPIYPIPGVMDSATAAEASRLYEEGTALMNSGSFHEGMSLIHEGYNLATYEPLIALSHNGRDEFRDLAIEIARDEERFVEVSGIILKALFK